MPDERDVEVQEREAMEALDRVAAIAGETLGGGAPAGARALAAPAAIPNPCDVLARIEGPLRAALWLIRRVPGLGRKVADAIELLLTLARQLCP